MKKSEYQTLDISGNIWYDPFYNLFSASKETKFLIGPKKILYNFWCILMSLVSRKMRK